MAHNGQLYKDAASGLPVPRPARISRLPEVIPARRHLAQLLSRDSLPEVSRGSEDAAKQTVELVVGVHGPLGASPSELLLLRRASSDRRAWRGTSCPPALHQAGPHGPGELWYRKPREGFPRNHKGVQLEHPSLLQELVSVV